MKAPKSRTKELRVACGNCGTVQESLSAECAQCGKDLYTNMEGVELAAISALVDALEQQLGAIEKAFAGKTNPYGPLDESFKLYRSLKAFSYLPGMPNYLDRVMLLLIPLRIAVMERTLRANLIFCLVLVLFPLAITFIGWHWMVAGLMVLPLIVWGLVTWKAWGDLKRARKHLENIRVK